MLEEINDMQIETGTKSFTDFFMNGGYEQITIDTKKTFFQEAVIADVEAGTNGYQGGDSGHGSRTFIRFNFEEIGCVKPIGEFDEKGNFEGFELSFGGDNELSITVRALEFILNTLKDQIEKNKIGLGSFNCMRFDPSEKKEY